MDASDVLSIGASIVEPSRTSSVPPKYPWGALVIGGGSELAIMLGVSVSVEKSSDVSVGGFRVVSLGLDERRISFSNCGTHGASKVSEAGLWRCIGLGEAELTFPEAPEVCSSTCEWGPSWRGTSQGTVWSCCRRCSIKCTVVLQ